MSDLPDRIWFDGLHASKYDPPNAIGYREFVRAELAPVIGLSRESLREALLAGSMPMIASKMSKSGESEAVEYVPLESVLDAVLRLIGSTEKKKIK